MPDVEQDVAARAGREDPLASAYVEGWHDAWSSIKPVLGTTTSPVQTDQGEVGHG